MHILPLYLGCVACVEQRGGRLGSRQEPVKRRLPDEVSAQVTGLRLR